MNSNLYTVLVKARSHWNSVRDEVLFNQWLNKNIIGLNSERRSIILSYIHTDNPTQWMQDYLEKEYRDMEPIEVFNSAKQLADNCGNATIKAINDWYIRNLLLRRS